MKSETALENNHLKKIIKVFLRLLIFLFGSILIYLLSAFFLSRISIEKEQSPANDIVIYIKTNGVHTDIVVPVRNSYFNWSEQVRYKHTIANDSTMQWLAFGWGDRGFYLETPTWADLKASTALKAAFGLGKSAIHATFYKEMAESKSCKKILISREQYERLTNYLLNSFWQDPSGNMIPISTNANYGSNDAFYEANGRYSLFFTCTTWANSALKASGQTSALWTPFDTGIFRHYR